MICVRRPALLLALATLAVAGCASHHVPEAALQTAPAGIDWTTTPTVSVALTDFDFTPDHPTFTSGKPIRLVLANNGSDRHDFSAPAFFAAASYRAGSTLPADGKVVVKKDQKAEIDLVPGPAGNYPLECTEFLHALFGMTGTITVTGSAN